jgi:hypothetical protein
MERLETAQVLAVLSAAFPYVPVTRETAEVYHDLLADIDYGICKAAVRDLLMTAERWPAPAEIRRAIAGYLNVLAPNPMDAWGEIIKAASTQGRIGTPQFSHQAVTNAVHAFGWRTICMSENHDTLRAHFLRAYELERVKSDKDTIRGLAGHISAIEPVLVLGITRKATA